MNVCLSSTMTNTQEYWYHYDSAYIHDSFALFPRSRSSPLARIHNFVVILCKNSIPYSCNSIVKRLLICYHPCRKYNGRLYFQFVCQSTPRGGTPSPSHNASTDPMFFPGGTPVTGHSPFPGGYPSPRQGYPSPRWRVPQSQAGGTSVWVRMGYPLPVQEWGTPCQFRMGYPPHHVRMGYPPPTPRTGYAWTAYGGVPLVVFRRRTFLLICYFTAKMSWSVLSSVCFGTKVHIFATVYMDQQRKICLSDIMHCINQTIVHSISTWYKVWDLQKTDCNWYWYQRLLQQKYRHENYS